MGLAGQTSLLELVQSLPSRTECSRHSHPSPTSPPCTPPSLLRARWPLSFSVSAEDLLTEKNRGVICRAVSPQTWPLVTIRSGPALYPRLHLTGGCGPAPRSALVHLFVSHVHPEDSDRWTLRTLPPKYALLSTNFQFLDSSHVQHLCVSPSRCHQLASLALELPSMNPNIPVLTRKRRGLHAGVQGKAPFSRPARPSPGRAPLV